MFTDPHLRRICCTVVSYCKLGHSITTVGDSARRSRTGVLESGFGGRAQGLAGYYASKFLMERTPRRWRDKR